jgi:hypothetical protein
MGQGGFIVSFFRKIWHWCGFGGQVLQPRDLLNGLFAELEQKKKLGIEDNAFVPNIYAIYLSPPDFDEIAPLVVGIREQLENKLMERISKKSYRTLAAKVSVTIREDETLQPGEVAIDSAFLKEDPPRRPGVRNEADMVASPAGPLPADPLKGSGARVGGAIPRPVEAAPRTRIIEERKTNYVDTTEFQLEVLDGERKGEVISLKVGEYIFGRGKGATILLKDEEETISRLHFKIVVRDGHASIKDLDSLNGTRLNDAAVDEAELKTGDAIGAGKVLLKVA